MASFVEKEENDVGEGHERVELNYILGLIVAEVKYLMYQTDILASLLHCLHKGFSAPFSSVEIKRLDRFHI